MTDKAEKQRHPFISCRIILVCIALLSTSAFADSTDRGPGESLDFIAGKYGVTGLAFVCFNQNGPLYQKYSGYADLERKIPVGTNTVFRFASVSKSFTGMALMRLVERGLVDLDEDVSVYLGWKFANPHYPNAKITLRKLLTHTAGLMDTDSSELFERESLTNSALQLSGLWNTNSPYYSKDLWSRTNPARREFCYCNLSSGIVATVIEKITGMRFDEYCGKYLFKPLQIPGGFGIRSVRDLNDLAASYERHGKSIVPGLDYFKGQKAYPSSDQLKDYKPGANPFLFEPQGGLRTTAAGLARLAGLFLSGGTYQKQEILSGASVREMMKVQWEGEGDPDHPFYHQKGLSLLITDDLIPRLRLFGHTGRKAGLISAFFFDPVSGTGFVFVANGLADMTKADSGFYEITESVARIYEKTAIHHQGLSAVGKP